MAPIELCVTLIDFLPLIKRVSQFLIKGEFFLERERGREREFYPFLHYLSGLALIEIPWPTALSLQTGGHSSARQEIRKLKNNHKGK